MALGSAYLWSQGLPHTWQDWVGSMVALSFVAVGSLSPDLDHKTSTASKVFTPFSAKTRRTLKHLSTMSLGIGVFLLVLKLFLLYAHVIPSLEWTKNGVIALQSSIPDELLKSYPLWLAAAILLRVLAILRDLILIGAGAALLNAYAIYQLSWFWAFVGVALFIIPLVRHRGVIHTPEFAVCLTIGIESVVWSQPWYIQVIGQGLAIGWWAHLIGDIFGSEGIESIFSRFVPWLKWLKVALHLFKNGGKAEKFIIRLSWSTTALILCIMMLQITPTEMYQSVCKILSI